MMRTSRLTKIEKLDYHYPGLADQVRDWFAQGVPVRQVPKLLFAKYHLRISETPVARFRRRRWVRELDMAREKRIETLIEQQTARGARRSILANPSRRGRKAAGNA